MKELHPELMHEVFMSRCLDLASNGLGQVAPNPMVGAVIVHKERVIGEGYHRQYGKSHAEVNAIESVKDKTLLEESTLYVNLEPCSHIGKTPPCSDLIIQKKIPHVVIGTPDPNPLVAGKGIEKLRSGGVHVVLNVKTPDCRELNRRFFTFHEKKRPYIILKWAQTKDGFIDINRKPGETIGINWISNSLFRMLVHKWRSEEQAILAGTNTIVSDNPQLTVREWFGENPMRIIVDRNLRIPRNANVLDNSAPTLVFNEHDSRRENPIEWIVTEFKENNLQKIVEELHSRQIQSVIVEGGRKILDSCIEQNLWDEARVIVGEKQFGEGLRASLLKNKHRSNGFTIKRSFKYI